MNQITIELYNLKIGTLWREFKGQGFPFLMACCYLFFEYVRPQSIWSVLDFYPYWARTFILLSLIGWMLDPNRKLVWNKITTLIFLFLFLIILSSFNAYWPEVSWKCLMLYLNWVVVYFVMTQTVTSRIKFFIVLSIFLIASFKLSFYGARTWALGGFGFFDWGLRGPEGFFENPGELAIQMVVFAPIAFFFARALRPYVQKWKLFLLYFAPISAAVTVIGTNTRGGQLALAAQIVAAITLSKNRIKTLIVIIIIVILGLQLLPEEQKERFKVAGDDKTSIQRILYWKHGWQMMNDHPLLGVGFFNFIPYYDKFYSDDLIERKRAELPHNIIIQVGTDSGFIGLAVFLGIIFLGFYKVKKIGKLADHKKDEFVTLLAKGMNLSLFGYFVSGQFVTVAYYPYLWIHLVFVTSISTFIENENKHKSMKKNIN